MAVPRVDPVKEVIKIVVCGSRGWRQLAPIADALDALDPGTLIITGGARGVDTMADEIARHFNLPRKVMMADWNTYGKRAGFLRNIAMLDEKPDEVWAFWDGESRGTLHTIRECVKRKINLRIVFSKDCP